MLRQTKEMSRHVEAVLKTLDILDCFVHSPDATLKEIIDKTGLNRSRVMRLIGTLESRGYLTYDPHNRTYRLGSRVMTLGKAYELNNDLITLARPVLKHLADQTGEMASLYILDKFERVAIGRERGHHPIEVIPEAKENGWKSMRVLPVRCFWPIHQMRYAIT